MINPQDYLDNHHTLLLVKPDVIERSLENDVIHFISQFGFKIIALRRQTLSRDHTSKLYAHLWDHPCYPELLAFMENEVLVTIWHHQDDAIAQMMKITGVTDSQLAEVGTVRNIWGTNQQRNAVDRSDSLESFKHELEIFKHAF